MAEKNVAVLEDYRNRLKGIHSQISRLSKEASALPSRGSGHPGGAICYFSLLAPRPLPGPHPTGTICEHVVKDIDTWKDFLDALNKIHQWTGYIIKVLDLNLKGIKPVKK